MTTDHTAPQGHPLEGLAFGVMLALAAWCGFYVGVDHEKTRAACAVAWDAAHTASDSLHTYVACGDATP